MGKPIITVGATTSHGGQVVQGNAASTINGVPIACVGDKVMCQAHGVSIIVTGDASFLIDGRPVARQGDKTSCGATLIANQALTVDDL